MEPVETAVGDSLGLVNVREVTARVEFFDAVVEDRCCGLFLRGAQNAVIGSPDHMQRLLGQGRAAAREATAAGKSSQGIRPARALQMQRSDLFFGSADIRIRFRKGLTA